MEAKDRIVKTNEYNCHNSLEERLVEQDEISFKVGEEEERKRWIKACMRACMLVSEPEELVSLYKAGIREGIRRTLERKARLPLYNEHPDRKP